MRKKIARRTRTPLVPASRPNQKWAMDFIAARLLDGRWFRVLTAVDLFTRESLVLLADSSLTGQKVPTALSLIVAQRGAPVSITVDNELSKKQGPAKSTPLRWLAEQAIGATIARWSSKHGTGAVACVSAHRQGSARPARRLTPPLTGAATTAERVISGS